MHKIDTLNAVVGAPAPDTPGTPGWFDKGDPEVPRDATHLDQDWCNAVQGELTAAIEAAGLTLDKDDRTQLLAAWPILARDKLHGFRADPQSPASMSVDVGSGTFYDGPTGALIVKGTQPSGTFVAPATNPRNDIIHIDARTGVVGVTAGTEAASPVDPVLTFGELPIARIKLTTATTEITAAQIDDIRHFNALGQGSPVFTRSFESTPQTITLASTATLAHSLGTSPIGAKVSLKCETAEFGFAVGDEVPIISWGASTVDWGIGLGWNSTSIYVTVAITSVPIMQRDAPIGNIVSITLASWKYIARAWA